REVDNGKSTERRSSIARAEGFGRRDVGAAGCGAVRGRRIERDPLDRSGKDGRTDAPTAGAAVRISRRRLERLAWPSRLDVQKKSAHALGQDRPDIRRRRGAWFDGQLDLDPAKLVFIDETGLSTKMARLRGRALHGERCR